VHSKVGDADLGTMYVCQHPVTRQTVALKILHEEICRDPAAVERFFVQARAASEVGNPHVAEVYECGKHAEPGRPDAYYIAMEALSGRRLGNFLARLNVDEALHVARQCGAALAASHARGVVHGDLRPENIVLVHQGGDPLFVKIIGFGTAHLAPRPATYASRKQCDDATRVDPRADIYALGVILYELLTKRRPFAGPNVRQTVRPPSAYNPRVDRALESIVLHALEKTAERRFQSMGDLLTALADPETHRMAYERPTVGAIPSRMPGAAAPIATRGKRWAASAALIVFTVLAISLAALAGGRLAPAATAKPANAAAPATE